jgi:hypothetical protein
MKAWTHKLKIYFTNRTFVLSVALGFVFLFASLVINFYAGVYATDHVTGSVGDIVLSNIPVFDVDGIFVWGPLVLWAFVAWLCLEEPQRIPYVLKSITLFILIRSAFVTMTHIGPYPTEIAISTGTAFIRYFSSGNDLFFSAHTGLPFLMAMLFYKDKVLRVFFIFSAIFFGVVVLLGHLHYTIDVMSAFFITYAISKISERFFPTDAKLFESGLAVKR